MITKTKTKKPDFFMLLKSSRSVYLNKQMLIKMAKKGELRPSQKTKIGRALSEYTKKSSRSYDESFFKTLKKLRPDWFLSQTQVANKKKELLIQMAKNEENRPIHDKTRIGQALSNYTRESSHVYDPFFDKLIRKLRPDWFMF